MTQERERLVDRLKEALLKGDVAQLNELGCSDTVMGVLAAEHAARCETLAKAIEPTMGRALLLMVSGALLQAANQIHEATHETPELVA